MTTAICPFHLRKELPELTPRIARLPVDPERGYPIPFFVSYVDGKPEFRMSDSAKFVRCVKEKLCWVCGEPLGSYKSFVIGPMCAINLISGDPPSHLDCALWSVRGCPFLTRPNMVRREDELTLENKKNVPGIMIERNPGVSLVWTTRSYQIIRDPRSKPLFRIDPAVSTSWWREGRAATRDEILESIESGVPLLLKECDREATETRQQEARAELYARKEEVIRTLLPGSQSDQPEIK